MQENVALVRLHTHAKKVNTPANFVQATEAAIETFFQNDNPKNSFSEHSMVSTISDNLSDAVKLHMDEDLPITHPRITELIDSHPRLMAVRYCNPGNRWPQRIVCALEVLRRPDLTVLPGPENSAANDTERKAEPGRQSSAHKRPRQD